MGNWTFLTNHAHVFIYVARDPGARVREIADAVGITERTAHGILSDLVDDGYLRRTKEGRRNRYECVEDLPMRHPVESEHRVGELLHALRG
ncbi:MarR family transcriptional regulator [Microbacterium sp. KSW4-11]|uniref:MarR family transcriptional regulator n=1 Tax=Microbacterium gawkjiense TaxID=3067309 RepID=A0ABU3GF58_9MICO|nr:helix-turn-helix domain-containing protein [Microbacterium sp. KSW4-11]MDT3318141.1 MarR family transcriptional regulator [Microbacterium sp. KSW4-11]